MREPKISLRTLRQSGELATVCALDPKTLLALVEVVEAAQRLNVLETSDPYPTSSWQQLDFRRALARFSDFDMEVSS